jgi:hypothetical protein
LPRSVEESATQLAAATPRSLEERATRPAGTVPQ